ncbi:MAG TPA: HypC/HybG/HupF family hydrogenase formation chaperone [Calditrichia bacterium]|nr:HypC/HybG/HupF family hydrogenase formation chaperone [Calditrichota bacterium]HQU74520.1 HypC/HybG/HupF family hydrogenase formation chaperone [Calditrichia bacterium]HQV31755.1 HypC/HybG/HupF family hydrogenase formation chaperone [Calditrichia bacterium]
MCLAIPGQIQEKYMIMDGKVPMAKVNFGGIIKEVSLEMLPEAREEDYVLVHVGFAISIVDEVEAMKVFEYLKEIGELTDLNPGEEFPELQQDDGKDSGE